MGLIDSTINPNSGALNKMQLDWNAYLDDPSITTGAVQAYGPMGGSLTRTATGATFKTPGGATWDWSADNPDFGTQASRSSELADYWKQTYGYELPGKSGAAGGPTGGFAGAAEGTTPSGTPLALQSAAVTGYDPTLASVNASTDTVSGQLDAILGKDSPLITRARAGAMQTANQRGLLNSTMAAQAGEAAAIDAALPIAQQDAGTFSTQRLANQGMSNTASQFGAGAKNQAAMFNAGETNALTKMQVQNQATAALSAQQAQQTQKLSAQEATQAQALQAANIAGQTAIQSLKGDQAATLSNIEGAYKTLIQTSGSAAYIWTQASNAIAAVMADPNTTPEQKQNGVAKLTAMVQAGLTIIGGPANFDLAGLLDFSDLIAA